MSRLMFPLVSRETFSGGNAEASMSNWAWFGLALVAGLALLAWISARRRARLADDADDAEEWQREPSNVSLGAGPVSEPGWRGWRCGVAGESYRNDDGSSRQEILGRAVVGEAVGLIPDPDNEHDDEAVRVILTGSGRQIGFLPRDHGLLPEIESGRMRARLLEITGGTAEKPSRGAILWVEVPRG